MLLPKARWCKALQPYLGDAQSLLAYLYSLCRVWVGERIKPNRVGMSYNIPPPPNRQTLCDIGFLLAVPALFQTSTTCLRLPEATTFPDRPEMK